MDFWYTRFTFERALAIIYGVAFLVAANQFVPLLGEHGLLPVSRFVRYVPFIESPSLFYFFPNDRAFTTAAWIGVALSVAALSGYPQRAGSLPAAIVWALLWLMYLSFVNVGQTFYGFGWETLLLETGFIAIFAGGSTAQPTTVTIWMWRWVLFRVMFGAGLIKLRGDPCWRDLTCLDYYFETQPIPNPLSWHFHWLPHVVHRAGVALNHFAELAVPFGYLAPQPVCGIAGIITIVFQLVLIVSGNLSWLNWLTIVLAISTLDNRWLSWLPVAAPAVHAEHDLHRYAVYAFAAAVAALSIAPVANMLSPNQMMNTSFEPLHLVNTYGAFGAITRDRYEIVIEGTADLDPGDTATWREYEFKGKPGVVSRMPPQIAPYHLRLDWLMWFAAMASPYEHPWFEPFLQRLLEGDRATLSLLETNPFPDHPPRFVRARYYRYRFTTAEERRADGAIWRRELQGLYYPAISLRR
jgi:Lipase maturation factor